MRLMRELQTIREGAVKDNLEDHIQAVIDRLPIALQSQPYHKVIAQIMNKVKEKVGPVDDEILKGMVETMFEPDDLKEAELMREGAVKDLHTDLLDAIIDEFNCDDNMAGRIADWLIDNKDDSKVDEFLYDHYQNEMPYGTMKARDGDPQNWIADHMERTFAKQLRPIWKASAPVREAEEDAPAGEQGDPNFPKLIAHADEYRVEMDEDEQVSLLDGEGTIRVTMPLVVWKNLCRQ